MPSSPVAASNQQQHSCPFAAALDADDSSSVGSAPALDDIKRCPAFQDSSCPFKDAKSSEQVRETLAKVPASHYDASGKFFQVVKELHGVQIDTSKVDKAFVLQGGCPVQQQLQGSVSKQQSFHHAMEDFSFAAVMANLAKQQEAGNEDDKEEQGKAFEKAVTTTQASSATTNTAPAASLSHSLKTGTAASHQAAEDVHFVANFIKGKIDRKLYAQLVHMLYCVYKILEECLDEHAQEHFASCHFPRQLARTPSLEQDMDFWFGTSIPAELSPATQDYVDRLQFIAKTDPLLLLAHSYTRYLGDLSGGKILARVAKRAMQLDKDDGLAFYQFTEIASAKTFKDEYRGFLDALPLNQEQIDKLVAEANVAFLLNVRLFEELDVMAGVRGATVRPLQEALFMADNNRSNDNKNNNGNAECPFADLAKMNKTKGSKQSEALSGSSNGHCPWPFILMHDPLEGCRDWKTWVMAGLVLCWIWSLVKP